MAEDTKYENYRFIAKVKKIQGANGDFLKVLASDTNPLNEDGTKNPYFEGQLLWLDAKTGKKFLVKSLSVKGVSAKSREHGFLQSLCVDLTNSYEVEELS